MGGLPGFSFAESLALAAIPPAIAAGGAIGSSAITADATRYSAQKQKEGALISAVIRAQGDLRVAEEQSRQVDVSAQAQVVSSAVGPGILVLGGLLLAAFFFGGDS